jgi:hypothetical protein
LGGWAANPKSEMGMGGWIQYPASSIQHRVGGRNKKSGPSFRPGRNGLKETTSDQNVHRTPTRIFQRERKSSM